jgi:hypothetical protein
MMHMSVSYLVVYMFCRDLSRALESRSPRVVCLDLVNLKYVICIVCHRKQALQD